MDTTEHTELGDSLRFNDWNTLKDNPYIHFDEKGTIHLDMQGLDELGMPTSTTLKLSSGMIVGMSGDYFGGKEVALELPTYNEFKNNPEKFEAGEYKALGEYLIRRPVARTEEDKLIRSYMRLANPEVKQKEIETIYTINNSNYIPFSETLNFYLQQIMFALRVKNYSEILNRNLSHFTPWSVRVYTISHHIALNYAKIAHELNQFRENSTYESTNESFNTLIGILKETPNGTSLENLQDLAHRYQVLALAMEFFGFHYYTDHFAAGHGSFIGDLRDLLPKRFGIWGGILVNSLHDELNRVTVYAKRPYDPTPDPKSPPIETGGDGSFNNPKSYFSHKACIDGMQCSLKDLDKVFQGQAIPDQSNYGGLEHMLDIDEKYRQPGPLFLLTDDNKIYYRTNLSEIETLSPNELQQTYKDPLNHGYTELKSQWEAFLLVVKLRVFPFIYEGKLQPLTPSRLIKIQNEEFALNPGREAIPQPPMVAQPTPAKPASVPVSDWRQPANDKNIMEGLMRESLFPQHNEHNNAHKLEENEHLTSSASM